MNGVGKARLTTKEKAQINNRYAQEYRRRPNLHIFSWDYGSTCINIDQVCMDNMEVKEQDFHGWHTKCCGV
ncbi:hypothetical protein DKX38_005578 [Salix brachista]|uniref:Uncharacterized protein n=1 Tax=Salix brachista TaxID=2182728 RepID=A0A5N5N2E5_9ROSI|nr:hypothetical protein DKX38_005578 [Salix brachista]